MSTTLTPDQVFEWALEAVNDFLLDGIEFLSVAENLLDDYPSATDEDFEAVHSETQKILNELRGSL